MKEEVTARLATKASLVLEPLSKSTENALKPLDLFETDRLFVWMDPQSDGKRFLMEARNVGGITRMPSYQASRNFFHRLPESRRPAGSDVWSVGATDFTALVTIHAWPEDRIIYRAPAAVQEDTEARQRMEYLVKRFVSQADRAALAAAFKINRQTPESPETWVEHPKLPASDYQLVAAMMAIEQEGMAFFMDRGTGKTATAIAVICEEARRKQLRLKVEDKPMLRVLIVCPQQVCTNWSLEFGRFATCKGKTVVVRGGPAERVKTLVHGVSWEKDCAFGAVIISYDSLVASLDAYKKVKWDRIVLDESHFIKDPGTNRWKAFKELRDSAKRRLIMTGTPIGNSPMDLWTQLEFLGTGMSGFVDFKTFRNFHGVFEAAGAPGIQKLVATRNVPLLQERLARLSFSVTKEEAGLKLPDKVYDVWEVQMTPKQAEIYDKIAEALFADIEDQLSGDVDALTVENILTKLLRLAQITSGHIVWDPVIDDAGNVLKPRRLQDIDVTNPKIDAVVEMMTAEDRDPLGKTIIWAVWVHDIKKITEALKAHGVECGAYFGDTSRDKREELVRRFNCDLTFKVLVANPQTAGEGLDLLGYDKTDPENSKTYCDSEVFFSQNWSYIQRSQAEDRCHRRGTRMPVRITDLVCPNTIDMEIRQRVNSKAQMADYVTNIREILSNVLKTRS
ncbi:chromatin remodeling complex ATPase-like protein [Caudoviricetes sp.]|nr:chromatin remodeling complex ATPase-like protein [Caudoviricetes sp.]UOF82737.1 chromatin remodeling complex ATPase-like protein [Caudoviricetes sp.]